MNLFLPSMTYLLHDTAWKWTDLFDVWSGKIHLWIGSRVTILSAIAGGFWPSWRQVLEVFWAPSGCRCCTWQSIGLNAQGGLKGIVSTDVSISHCPIGDLLFLRNGFRNLCITFFKKYLYVILDFFYINCQKLHIGLAKSNYILFNKNGGKIVQFEFGGF